MLVAALPFNGAVSSSEYTVSSEQWFWEHPEGSLVVHRDRFRQTTRSRNLSQSAGNADDPQLLRECGAAPAPHLTETTSRKYYKDRRFHAVLINNRCCLLQVQYVGCVGRRKIGDWTRLDIWHWTHKVLNTKRNLFYVRKQSVRGQ